MMDWIGIDDLLLVINFTIETVNAWSRHGRSRLYGHLYFFGSWFDSSCFGSILSDFVSGKMIHRLAVGQGYSPAVLQDD